MSTLTIVIVSVFILGYLCIALESVLKINKAAIALFMFVICWTFYMVNPMPYLIASGYTGGEEGMLAHIRHIIESHLGETAETLFFLMGAMTIVEIVDSNGGFNFVRNALRTTSKRKLMWRMAFLTFILSAILDNLTTSIVMIMLLHKLVTNHNDRLVYASMIIIAANSGGAFSPIGDVTTIMLWIGNMITTGGVIKEIFIPSLISMVVPVFILQYMLKGELVYPKEKVDEEGHELSQSQRQILFVIGVGGLIFVPVFRYLTDLPPFMGILLILSILWIVTEIFYSGVQVKQGTFANRVSKVLSRIDLPTIMFFLGILMAVGCLSEIGVLTALGQSLDKMSGGNHYLVTGVIGVLSSIVDNVPLVAGCMKMYPIVAVGDFAVDGIFWQLLAYCAGVGGSMLIIGSAAGVVVMGIEKITFGWYMKKISWIVFVGYIAGMFSYYLIRTYLF